MSTVSINLMQIIPIQTDRVELHPDQDLQNWIQKSINLNKQHLHEEDILIVSSKVLSYFEDRVIDLSTISVSEKAIAVAKRMNSNPELMQIAMDEADEIITETLWVLLTRKHGVYNANAGVDCSNAPKGYAVLLPKDPFSSAKKIREWIKKEYILNKCAVIIIDSTCIPGRKGTCAIAIGFGGIRAYCNLSGEKDLFQKTLRYSGLNIVDSLATAANVVMGESAESIPLAIIRDYTWESSEKTKNDEMLISSYEDIYQFS